MDERNYHVFYQMIAGAMASPELRRELHLEPARSFTYLNQSGCYTLDGISDTEMFDQLRLALQVGGAAGGWVGLQAGSAGGWMGLQVRRLHVGGAVDGWVGLQVRRLYVGGATGGWGCR